MPEIIQNILRELKEGLVGIYGDQLQAMYLYGSYARGDAHPPNSDIDVMIVLRGEFDYWDMDERCSQFVAKLSLKHDVVVSVRLASAAQYALSKFPLYINARKEGVAV